MPECEHCGAGLDAKTGGLTDAFGLASDDDYECERAAASCSARRVTTNGLSNSPVPPRELLAV